jgi:hypothetical protein
LKDPGIDGRIILKWILEKWDGDIDWIDMAEDRDRLRLLVNAVINHKIAGFSLSGRASVIFSGRILLHGVS